MSLSQRQNLAYNDVIDVYRGVNSATLQIAEDGSILDDEFEGSPHLVDIPCRRETKEEFTETTTIGRTDRDDIVFTIDVFHCELGLDIRTNDLIRYMTPGAEEYGQYFVVLGEAQRKNWRANKQSLRAKRYGLTPVVPTP